MDIIIIGTGNVASILGKKILDAGHIILQVYGRDAKAASELAYELNSESTNYWSVVQRNADLYILAVSDIAIEEVVKELQLPDKTVVHTAGAVSKDILKNASSHYGVFYPLQSLKRTAPYLPQTPLLIDASDETTLQQLERLATSISDQVWQVKDEERLKMHMAAVFCNNFVNHLYALMEAYCEKEGLNFQLLIPLIQETAMRLNNIKASNAQTGPAIRRDATTIEKHMALLDTHSELKMIYQLFTQSIQQKN